MNPVKLGAALAVAFALLVGLELHGLSLAAWHAVIDDSEPSEVLVGEPRRVRADDWRVVLPLAFSQVEHEPAFPFVNSDIGLGQPVAVPLQLPVGGPLALFRPTLWGFFLGKDIGTAWLWWSGAFGLFTVWTLVLARATGARLSLAAMGAFAIVYSPFFQFWSLNFASVAITAGLVYLGADGVLTADRPRAVLSWGLLLGWAAGCFLLVSYPPFMVPLAWLVLVLLAIRLWAERARVETQVAQRLAAAGVSVAVVAAAALVLVFEAGDAIGALGETAYPGARVSTGGDARWWHVFSHNLAFAWQVERWGPLRNISSASAFPLFFPVIAVGVAASRAARRDPLCLALLATCVALALFAAAGIPEWLARATGFSFVEGRRSVIGLGLADALLVVRWLSLRDARAGGGIAIAAAAGFAIWLLAGALALREALPDVSLAFSLLAIAVNGAIAWLLLSSRPRAALGLLAAGVFLSTAWFNPLARGGSDFLTENELSRRILGIDRERGGDSFWLALGSPSIGNLFRAIGVRSLTGVQPVPQLALWEKLDPGGENADVYNRYANVIAEPSPDGATRVRLQARDVVVIELSPTATVLDDLGVTHLVVTDPGRPPFEDRPPLRYLGSAGPHHLYERDVGDDPRP